MVIFPNCKINIGLHIVGKRNDGFHNLETVFFPVPVNDALEIIPAQDHQFSFSQSGLAVDGPSGQNLCVRAWELLRARYPEVPPVHMHLHKAIPMGAGLGGGSSDAAHTLMLLNQKFKLALPEQELINIALELGSDCPFFILNKPCFATGRGEMLEPLTLNLNGHYLALINPGIHVNTGWAFRQITPKKADHDLQELVQLPVQEWRHCIINDFEEPVSAAHPLIRHLRDGLYDLGAQYAAMSGSGSTIFGLFDQQPSLDEIHTENECWKKVIRL